MPLVFTYPDLGSCACTENAASVNTVMATNARKIFTPLNFMIPSVLCCESTPGSRTTTHGIDIPGLLKRGRLHLDHDAVPQPYAAAEETRRADLHCIEQHAFACLRSHGRGRPQGAHDLKLAHAGFHGLPFGCIQP